LFGAQEPGSLLCTEQEDHTMTIRSRAPLSRQDTSAGSRPSRWALPIAAGAGFLAGLDTTAVNLALPDIQRTLSAGLSELQWVVNAFALLSAALLVTAGNLSDRCGRRRVFVAGLLAFAGASAACGLAPSALLLDLARAAQGAAAAVVTASGLAVLASLYPPAERGRALGVYGAIAALSFVVGPLVGGLLTDTLGWRSVFIANVPVAVLLAVSARAVVPELRAAPADRTGWARFDHAGVATFTLGFGALLYAALRGGDAGWANAEVAVAAALGVAGLTAFVAVERRTVDGVVDLHLFRDRTFTGAVAGTALAGAAYFGMLVYLSLFLQGTRSFDALATGLVYLPTILPFIVISPFTGRLLARIPGARIPATGVALIACGMLLLLGVDEGAGLLDVTLGMAVAGLGTGLAVTPLTQLALARVPTERSGMASGVLQTARPVGVTLGVTLLGLAVPGRMDAAAFRSVAAIAAGIAAVGAVVAATMIRPAAGARTVQPGRPAR
jgi:EmrB/QacA subfamily drug resistance transporter